MIAIWVIPVIMVAIPVSAVILPVLVSTVSAVIVPVSTGVSLIAVSILVVVAVMVATCKHYRRPSKLDSDGYLGLRLRRQRQANSNNQTESCKYHLLQHALNLHYYHLVANHRRYSYSLTKRS